MYESFSWPSLLTFFEIVLHIFTLLLRKQHFEVDNVNNILFYFPSDPRAGEKFGLVDIPPVCVYVCMGVALGISGKRYVEVLGYVRPLRFRFSLFPGYL